MKIEFNIDPKSFLDNLSYNDREELKRLLKIPNYIDRIKIIDFIAYCSLDTRLINTLESLMKYYPDIVYTDQVTQNAIMKVRNCGKKTYALFQELLNDENEIKYYQEGMNKYHKVL